MKGRKEKKGPKESEDMRGGEVTMSRGQGKEEGSSYWLVQEMVGMLGPREPDGRGIRDKGKEALAGRL